MGRTKPRTFQSIRTGWHLFFLHCFLGSSPTRDGPVVRECVCEIGKTDAASARPRAMGGIVRLGEGEVKSRFIVTGPSHARCERVAFVSSQLD